MRSADYLNDAALLDDEHFAVSHAICPEQEITDYIARLFEFPEALQVLEFADGRVTLVCVRAYEGGLLVGKPIKAMRELLPPEMDARIAAIFRGDQPVFPEGDTTVEAGDEVFLLAAAEHILEPLGNVALHLLGFVFGTGLFLLMSLIYFTRTNTDVTKLTGKAPEEYQAEMVERDIIAPPMLDPKVRHEQRKASRWLRREQRTKKWHVETYLTGRLRLQLARSSAHYDRELLRSVLWQNHINGSIFEVVVVLSVIALGAFSGPAVRDTRGRQRFPALHDVADAAHRAVQLAEGMDGHAADHPAGGAQPAEPPHRCVPV